jgi:predicted nucleic acid-binding Zn ribbon protein
MVFQFVCKKCGQNFNVSGHIGSVPTKPVCQCGGEVVRRFEKLPVKFRCSGFYSTDKVLSEPEPDDFLD